MTSRTRFNHSASSRSLPQAVAAGDLARAAAILQETSVDIINLPAPDGQTPLSLAAAAGKNDMLDLLLAHDRSGIDKIYAGSTLATMAATRGDVDTLHVLAAHGAALDLPDDAGFTPLMCAYQARRYDTLRQLLRMGADIGCKNNAGQNLVHTAAEANNGAALEILLAHGGLAHLESRCEGQEARTPLHLAVASGAEETVQLLIDAGAQVNTQDEKNITPLQTAAKTKETSQSMILTLVTQGHADINRVHSEDGQTALHIAAAHGDVAAMRLLIDLGADAHQLDSAKRTPLNLAAWMGSLEGVRLLMEDIPAEPDANAAAQSRVQALYDALFYAHDDIAEYMIDSGQVDMNRPTYGGDYLLQAALQGGRSDLAEKIIAAGADIDTPNRQNTTPLLLCARRNLVVPASLLLSKGANPNLHATAEPPLHAAIAGDHRFMVTLLLQNGADPRLPDTAGQSALDLARIKGLTEILGEMEQSYPNMNNMKNINPHQPPPRP